MNKKVKTLLSSGCSFTAGTYTWPNHVADILKLQSINYGKNGAGNGYISRSIIYGVNNFLQNSISSELLVGIMWSGSSRHENFHSDDSHSSFKIKYNFFDQGSWVRLNPQELDSYSSPYFRLYYDHVGALIHSLEHILRTQWFLQNNKIDYFMTCYSTDVLPELVHLNNPNISYLYNLINWDKFLPVDNCMEWCAKSGIPGNAPDEETRKLWLTHTNRELNSRAKHPSTLQHQEFAKQVILPYIYKHYITL